MILARWNQKERAFQALDSRGQPVENFESKWKAENRGLKAQAPDLYNMTLRVVRQYPELKSRAWKGAIIAFKQLVHFIPSRSGTEAIAEVKGSGVNVYEIGRKDGMLTCTCQDWTGFKAPLIAQGDQLARMCKHIIAYQLSKSWRDNAPKVEPTHYSDGQPVPFSLQRKHERFVIHNGRQAENRIELITQ